MTQYAAIVGDYVAIKDSDLADKHILFPSFYRAIGNVRGKNVLEFACGEGRAGRGLIERGATHVLGVDKELAMVMLAKSRQVDSCSYLNAVVGTLGQIGCFDVIIGPWILHYAERRQELFSMFRDVALNLKPGGIFVALNEDPRRPVGGSERVGYTVTAEDVPLADGTRLRVTLYGEGRTTSFITRHWSLGSYLDAAHAAGLELELIDFEITQGARNILGADWCDEFMATRTSCVFRCRHG